MHVEELEKKIEDALETDFLFSCSFGRLECVLL